VYARYERTPAIDTAHAIARALDVSLDYLVGDAAGVARDQSMMYRLELLAAVPAEHRERILYTLDVLLRDAQAASLDSRLA